MVCSHFCLQAGSAIQLDGLGELLCLLWLQHYHCLPVLSRSAARAFLSCGHFHAHTYTVAALKACIVAVHLSDCIACTGKTCLQQSELRIADDMDGMVDSVLPGGKDPVSICLITGFESFNGSLYNKVTCKPVTAFDTCTCHPT